MKNIFLLFSLIPLFLSCSHEKQFPDYLTQKVSKEQLTANLPDTMSGNFKKDSRHVSYQSADCLNQVTTSVNYYIERNPDFNFKRFVINWNECKDEITYSDLNEMELEKWIEATGLLLQLTSDARYAEELEKIFYHTSSNTIKKEVAGYAITKNVDHLHVNLFIPAKIQYEHSLKGSVSMLMETSYPEKGKVDLIFNMEKKRYVELFIRIPSWAKDAHVTAEGVKYLAPPGGYCKIARQWKEGDSVQIIFPLHDRENN